MLGKDYNSFENFKNACKNQRTPINPRYLLCKVYNIHQIKNIIQKMNIDLDEMKKFERIGIGKRYEYIDAIHDEINENLLGTTLPLIEHNLFFQYLTYGKLSNEKPFSSKSNFLAALNKKDATKKKRKNRQFFNGITNPAGRKPQLESIYTPDDNDHVSLLYSCTRVLTIPDADSYTLENYFLARIPVAVKIYFDLKLIEFSIPDFSEPIAADFGWDNRLPIRFQKIFFQICIDLETRLSVEPIRPYNLRRFSLYLENILEAQDMGWIILPEEEAEFNLKQNTLPLKTIFNSFTSNLNKEIEKRGKANLGLKFNLYEVFRAMKEQSHTHTLVLKVPYRKNQASFFLSVIYGNQDSEFIPLITLSKNNKQISELLRKAVCNSQTEHIENVYNLDKILEKIE